MPRIDIRLEQRKICDFHGNDTDAPLWGIVVIIPAPEFGYGKTKEAFICEMCLRNQIHKIDDKSYMRKEDAIH